MQPIIKFEVFAQIVFMNTDSNLPRAYIFRSAQGLYDILLLIYRSAPPVEASIAVCLIE